MSKLVLILSVLSLMILLVFGVINPDSPVMWMASISDNFTVLRLFLIGVLLSLLVIDPPGHIHFQSVIGMLAVMLVSWTLSATYQNHLQPLDTLSLLEVSISAGLVALEREPVERLPFPKYEISPVRRLHFAKQ